MKRLGLILVVAALSLGGCKLLTPREPEGTYFTRGCLTGDGATLAMVGDGDVLLDLTTGRALLQRYGYHDSVHCLGTGAIAFADSDLWTFTADAGSLPRKASGDLVGVLGERGVVTYYRHCDTRSRGGACGQATLSLEEAREGAPQPITVPLEAGLFPGLGEGAPASFDTFPVRTLPDGRVLLAGSFAMGAKSEPRPLGLFALDLKTKQASPWAPPLTDGVLNRYGLQNHGLAASAKGEVVFGAFAKPGTPEPHPMVIAGLEQGTGKERFRTELQGGREVYAIAASPSGDRVAAALTLPGGSTARVEVLDGKTGARLWQRPLSTGSVAFLAALADGSVVIAGANRQVQRVGRDGKTLWEWSGMR
ncbi:MAG: PQQ-binding-like beta-propeller repeat protein [Myxococcaceae bacterium]